VRAPLVGREAELGRLDAALALAQERKRACAVALVGPQGVGKTRLWQEFVLRRQRGEGPVPRLYRGSARGSTSPLAVFAAMLRDRFGLLDGMAPETTRMWVRSQVTALLGDSKMSDVLYFVGQLLDLPFPESPLTRAVMDDPAQGRYLQRAVLRRLIEADAATGPVLLVLDDLHEALDEALELAAYLIDAIVGPVLVVVAGRNELFHRSEALARVIEGRHDRVDLGLLGEREAATVVEALLSPCPEVPDALVRSATDMARGNPMLLERMVRIFHDTGVLEAQPVQGDSEPRWLVRPERLSTVKLPLTLDDAVEARLGALDPLERRLLERATLMGSVFWLGGLLVLERLDAQPPELWSASGEESARLQQTLEELVARDYVLRLPDSAFADDVEYVFKHSRERERLSQQLSSAEARRCHQAIADWLDHKEQIRSHEEHMGLLARQRELAGARELAALGYLDAGDVARSRYANARAAEYYQRGLDLLGDASASRRLAALHGHGDALQHLGRADEAMARFREMLALAFRLRLEAKGGAAHNRIGRLHRDTGKLTEAARHLEAGLALFRAAGDDRGVASSVDDLGKLHWLRGDYDRALVELSRALEMRQALGDRRSIALSLNNLGLALHDSGRFREAREAFERSLGLRREVGDLLGVVTSLNNIGTLAQDQQEHSRAFSFFQEALVVAREVGDKNRIALVLTNIGETHYRLGRLDEAITILGQAEELCDELGDKLGLAEAARGLAKAHLLAGNLVRARTCIARAIELFTVVRSKVHLGVALRTLGEITAAGGWGDAHSGKAYDYFLQSLRLFEEMGNQVEQARSCQSLARYLDSTGDPAVRDEAEQMHQRAALVLEHLRGSGASLGAAG
jgi:tetratricopeptide (TPR) repeat protein